MRNDALGLAVLGRERQPTPQGATRRIDICGLAFDLHLTAIWQLYPKQQLCGFAAPGTKQAREADDFARCDLQIDWIEQPAFTDACRLQEGRLGSRFRRHFELLHFFERPPKHGTDQLQAWKLGRSELAHEGAISQNRDSI